MTNVGDGKLSGLGAVSNLQGNVSVAGSPFAAGQVIDLGLVFGAGATPGMHAATLLLRTDENAALGQSGTEFSYTLAAASVTPVPEPHSVAMLLAGLCLVGMRLRIRRAG